MPAELRLVETILRNEQRVIPLRGRDVVLHRLDNAPDVDPGSLCLFQGCGPRKRLTEQRASVHGRGAGEGERSG